MKVALSILVLVIFTGCAGGFQNFKTDESFQVFVNDLGLSRLSVAEASGKLASNGFVCKHYEREPAGEVFCVRGTRSGQQQAVRLSPDPSDSSHSLVVATLTMVLA